MAESKPLALVITGLSPAHQAQLAERMEVIYAPEAPAMAAALAQHGPRVQLVLTIGSVGLTAAQMDAMPRLELVSALGAGYENIDITHARARGIALANGAGTNDDCVADHAFGLLIAAMRGLVRLDRQTRQGLWRNQIPLSPNVSGKRLGILGMGTIGAKIARRAQGFDMPVGYCNRHPKAEVAHRYFESPLALAEWADILLVATPGGAATRHLVTGQVLEALGPQGVLVNIARGSVVDTRALAQALVAGQIAAAGLDVYESEPLPPAELLALDQVVLTPHVAGWSPEAIQASVDRFLENARLHFARLPLRSPI